MNLLFLFLVSLISPTVFQRTTPPCTRTHHIIFLPSTICLMYSFLIPVCVFMCTVFLHDSVRTNVIGSIAHCKSDPIEIAHTPNSTWPLVPNRFWPFRIWIYKNWVKMDQRVRICIWKPQEEDVVQVICVFDSLEFTPNLFAVMGMFAFVL